MTNLENLKKLAEGLGADASGAETNAAAIGVIAEAAAKVTDLEARIGDASEFTSTERAQEDWSYTFGNGTSGAVGGNNFTMDVTSYMKLSMLASVEGDNGSMWVYFLPKEITSTSGQTPIAKIASTGSKVEEEIEIDCTGMTGEYRIWFSAMGSVSIKNIFAEFKVADDIAGAIKYLLSLHE